MRGLLALVAALPLVAPTLTAAREAAPAEEAAVSGSNAKVWLGRHPEFEEYLRTAPIERMEKVGQGVTNPDRAFFVSGGPAESALIKVLPPRRMGGYWESYKSEIAAYELDRILELDMVPVTVERQVGGLNASAQLWLNGVRLLKSAADETPKHVRQWARQVCRQRIFDSLVANIDRNARNILIDGEWNVILIDHSRAFAQDRMPFVDDIIQTDREFYDRLKALDEATLMERVRPWLFSDKSARQILERRDKIVEKLDGLVKQRGEAAVFPF